VSIHRGWILRSLSGVTMAVVAFAGLGRAAGRGAPDVQWFGSFKEIIHEGRIEGRTRLATAMVRPHAYALGAMARLYGEFVVLDGKVFLSRPDDRGGVVSTTSVTGNDSVALMVFAHVAAWSDLRVSRAIPLVALQDTVAACAAKLGLPRGGPLPFLIEGAVSNLHWHVADGRNLPPGPSSHEAHTKAAIRGERDHVSATLLGFYSDHHTGIFLHHDINVHVHVVLPEERLAGHVDEVTVEPGATLRMYRARK